MGTEITWGEIRSTLQRCKNNKATGMDGVPCEVYKVAESEETAENGLSNAILRIANYCLDTGNIPEEWNECTVVPIFKKGETRSLDNYRGITLVNTLCKVILKVMAKRLATANKLHGLIRKEQIGFIEGEEGLSAVMTALEICERRKIVTKGTILIFIDLAKAYDRVPQALLMSKLRRTGLGARTVNLIEALYRKTALRVRLGKEVSEPFKYERGVRQGCPLSPLLFDIFINDLMDDMPPVPVPGMDAGMPGICFADDTLLFANDQADAQEKLNRVEEWMNNNGMSVNVSKCGIMSIGMDAEPTVLQGRGGTECERLYIPRDKNACRPELPRHGKIQDSERVGSTPPDDATIKESPDQSEHEENSDLRATDAESAVWGGDLCPHTGRHQRSSKDI